MSLLSAATPTEAPDLIGVGIIALFILIVGGIAGLILYLFIKAWWVRTPLRVNKGNAQEKLDALHSHCDALPAIEKCLALGAHVRHRHIMNLARGWNSRNLQALLLHDSSLVNEVEGGTNALGAALRAYKGTSTIHVLREFGARTRPETVRWATLRQHEYTVEFLRESGTLDSYGLEDDTPSPLYDALDHPNPDERVVEYLLLNGARIDTVQVEFERTFSRSGSRIARRALVRLREIQNARARIDGAPVDERPNIWDHLD